MYEDYEQYDDDYNIPVVVPETDELWELILKGETSKCNVPYKHNKKKLEEGEFKDLLHEDIETVDNPVEWIKQHKKCPECGKDAFFKDKNNKDPLKSTLAHRLKAHKEMPYGENKQKTYICEKCRKAGETHTFKNRHCLYLHNIYAHKKNMAEA